MKHQIQIFSLTLEQQYGLTVFECSCKDRQAAMKNVFKVLTVSPC